MQTLLPTDKDYWKQIVASSNLLGLQLLPQIQTAANAGNVVLSPTSIFVILSMLYNGACGNTYLEMAQALGLPTDKELNPWMRQLINFINGHNQPELDIQLVNALWFRPGEALHFDFANAMSEIYSASLYSVDFAQTDATARVNAWVANATRGSITRLIDNLSADTRFVLTNAIYFNGRWENPFASKNTRERDFFIAGGGTKKVLSMAQTEYVSYFEDPECQSILLPYSGGNYAMHIALPRKVQSPNVLLPRVEELIFKTKTRPSAKLAITMPKFEISFGFEVQNALQGIGIRDLSDQNSCDLGRIGSNLVCSRIVHKATIKVHELGSEASASTAAMMSVGGIAIEPIVEMNIDHPFVYSICDKVTGQILFTGTYCEP